jgi:hypothetical protein
MRAGQLPVDEQLAHFRGALRQNSVLIEVLARAATMDLPGWYLVAGCLYQTVWNVVTGQPAQAGILDDDVAYFDDSDLSWEAEDEIIHPVLAPRHVYQAKTARWRRQWPGLTILPWPGNPQP